LESFYDGLWDALPELDMKRIEQEARIAAHESTRRILPEERARSEMLFYLGYLGGVSEAIASKAIRAEALKNRDGSG
jgi:hypothetical protein